MQYTSHATDSGTGMSSSAGGSPKRGVAPVVHPEQAGVRARRRSPRRDVAGTLRVLEGAALDRDHDRVVVRRDDWRARAASSRRLR